MYQTPENRRLNTQKADRRRRAEHKAFVQKLGFASVNRMMNQACDGHISLVAIRHSDNFDDLAARVKAQLDDLVARFNGKGDN